MSVRASNISFDGAPVELELTSPCIVLIDPLALDGLRTQLQKVGQVPLVEQRRLLREQSQPLRIGLHDVTNFRPGVFRVSVADFERADDSPDPGTVDIDSGTMVLADLAHLARVAQVLTWKRYDLALRAPSGDDTAFMAMRSELGGPFCAVLSASGDTAFDGDGAFRLRDNAPTQAS